jgi:hypothetical protein
MRDAATSETRWNLFARELEDILAERGWRLGHLDDFKDLLGGPLIHREKVRRLQLSLRRPKSFTVLNPDELQQVIQVLQLTAEERVRLHAALLTTAIEVMLMDRIEPQNALAAAEQILPILRQAIQAAAGVEGLPALRGSEHHMKDDTTALDNQFGKALDTLDRATLALHMSQSSATYLEKIEQARLARDGFQTALRLLEKADAQTRTHEDWRMWHNEAHRGRARAAEVLTLFAAQPDQLA